MPRVVPLAADEAVAAVTAVAGAAPAGGKYVACQSPDSLVTTVSIHDADDREGPQVWAGGGWLLGPDGKVFSLSSNPGIHDWDVATRLLDHLYRAGLASRVVPEVFVDRLRQLTEDREELVRVVVREAAEGRLRPRPPRQLP